MQELCQKHQLLEKIKNKELKPVLLKERHANPLKSGQVFCTYSQLLSYQNSQADEVMKVHQYKKPDGSLGPSKMPDPVWMFIDGIIYKLETKI